MTIRRYESRVSRSQTHANRVAASHRRLVVIATNPSYTQDESAATVTRDSQIGLQILKTLFSSRNDLPVTIADLNLLTSPFTRAY
jgi:hypothetical protein